MSGFAPAPPPYQSRGTNTLAVVSLVVSVVSLAGCAGLTSIVGALLGHRARAQIRRSGEEGAGLALAGIIVGWVGVLVLLALVGLVALLFVTESGGPCDPDAAGC